MANVEVKKRIYGPASSELTSEIYWLAKDFSDSVHFTIIDSYSTITGRYKGDPIANGVWTGTGSLSNSNNWFVVECQTQHPKLAEMGYSGLQKWQAKYQFVRSVAFADVSDPTGIKYPKNHGVLTLSACRFAPYGGWDLADSLPDFNPSSPPGSGDVSTQNHRTCGATYISANDETVVHIFANGAFIRLTFYNNTTYQKLVVVNEVIGDVIPLKFDLMPNPRAMFRPGSSPGYIYNYIPPGGGMEFLAEDNDQTNGISDYKTTDSVAGGIAFWDDSEVLVESGYTQPTQYHLFFAQISRYSNIPPAELLPFIPIPWKSGYQYPYFSFPYVRKGAIPGIKPINNKQWLAGGNGYGPYFVWDGVTDSPMES